MEELCLQFGSGEAVSTFVFMDFETTGRVAQRSEYPRITEMSFISVPREVFVRGQARMKELSDMVASESLYVRLAANVHSRQLNPELDEKHWTAYEASRIAGKIAHNGLAFDYRVLYGELKRCDFIDKDMGIPDGVSEFTSSFIDSYLAIRELEERHRTELQQATRLVDWKMLSEQVCLSRVPACEDIPAAIEEDANRIAQVDLKDLEGHLAQQQCPVDPLTPTRPPPPRGTLSEPAKLSGRRRLFDSELPGNDHPLLFLNTEDWSPAKRRRVRPEYFRRLEGGRWDFNRTVAQMNTKNKLTTIYETVLKKQFTAHYAQDDTEALMQVCLAYGKEFVDYADNKSADFPF
ncbi:hypothetical protein OSTOST_10631 [Ostertagia ostertagi]